MGKSGLTSQDAQDMLDYLLALYIEMSITSLKFFKVKYCLISNRSRTAAGVTYQEVL